MAKEMFAVPNTRVFICCDGCVWPKGSLSDLMDICIWIGTLSIVHWYGTSATMCTNITYTIKITAMAHIHYSDYFMHKIIVSASNQSNVALIGMEAYNSPLKLERYYITCLMRFGVLSLAKLTSYCGILGCLRSMDSLLAPPKEVKLHLVETHLSPEVILEQ